MIMGRKIKSKSNDNSPAEVQFKHYGNGEKIDSHTRERKSASYLTLAIMGGAAFFVLRGCEDGNADNDGDGVFYSSPQDCIKKGNSAQLCTDAWNSAKTTFENELPKNMSQEDCSRQYGQCYYNNVGQSWTPVLAGFLLSQVVRENRDDKDTNTSTNTSSVGGGSGYSSRAVWNTSSGDYAWRSDSKKSADARYGITVRKATTIARGGYGRSSGLRGSWGG